MSVQVENLEKNMAKLTIEVSAEEFDKAVKAAYQKQKGKISIPGFRKGKVPQAMVEKMYGVQIFFEDAANALIGPNYEEAAAESKLDIVSQPEIDVVQIEKGKPFIFTAEVAVKPDVTLGTYKGVEVLKSVIEVTDEEIDAEVKKEQEQNSRTIDVDDRAAAMGDIVTIDFKGTVDGIAFEGGEATNHELTLGSGSFIPGFEEQLVGKNLEEDTDVTVTFPEDYQAKELAGKEAVFACTIHKIQVKELPELGDEFAQDVSEFDTMDEYKEDLKKVLLSKKEEEAKRAKEDAAVDAATATATMEIPEAMITTQVHQMIDDFKRRIQSQGLTFEQYMQFTGSTPQMVEEQMKPQAEKRIRTRLVLEKIAETEQIEVSQEKLDKEIEDLAKMYQMEADKFKDMIGDYEKEQMKKDLAVQEAVTFIAENATEVDKIEEPAAEAAEEEK